MLTSKKNSRLTKISFWVVLLLFNSLGATMALAQEPPLVYDKENTGANFPQPILLPYDQLPFIRPLPDPFAWADGSGRDTSFANWERRRNEIKAMIEKWDIGPKPTNSDLIINAAYTPGSPGTLVVDVTRLSNGTTLRLTSTIALPSGTPPAAGWPAMIEMAPAPGGSASGGIASISYVHDDVTQYAAGQQVSHAGDPYFLMYPEFDAGCSPGAPGQPPPPCPLPGRQQVGQYVAWSWGVSRLIDGIEIASHQAVNPLPIDVKHLGVHGCSYAGKMALFAGAFDERIALTHAQENGGGGQPAWRTSQALEPQGAVENAQRTDGSWFINSMKSLFAGNNAYKFPADHHELAAMVAPRALIETGNTDFIWLSNRSNLVSSRATQKVYESLGIGDRYGFAIDGSHGHCATPSTEAQAGANAFRNRFLLGQDVPTDVHIYPARFADIDTDRWTEWWETGVPNDPRYNVALALAGSTVFADSEYSDGRKSYPASAAIDGDTTGNSWRSGGGWSDGTADAYPDILEVDFNGPQVIDEINIYTLANNYKKHLEPTSTTLADVYGIEDFEVQTNTTTCVAGGPCTIGTTWTTVPGGYVTGNTLAWRQFTFPNTITATKLRVVVYKARNHYSRIVELKALGFPAGFPTFP
jgi:Glucuronyl esterase, fungi